MLLCKLVMAKDSPNVTKQHVAAFHAAIVFLLVSMCCEVYFSRCVFISSLFSKTRFNIHHPGFSSLYEFYAITLWFRCQSTAIS